MSGLFARFARLESWYSKPVPSPIESEGIVPLEKHCEQFVRFAEENNLSEVKSLWKLIENRLDDGLCCNTPDTGKHHFFYDRDTGTEHQTGALALAFDRALDAGATDTAVYLAEYIPNARRGADAAFSAGNVKVGIACLKNGGEPKDEHVLQSIQALSDEKAWPQNVEELISVFEKKNALTPLTIEMSLNKIGDLKKQNPKNAQILSPLSVLLQEKAKRPVPAERRCIAIATAKKNTLNVISNTP